MASKIISLKCKSNGPYGQIFAAAISVQTRNGGEILNDKIRIRISAPTDPWVAEHVIPALDHPQKGIQEQQGGEADLWRWWRRLYDPLKRDGFEVLVHVAWPVEMRLLWEAHALEPFSGPFPLLDVAGHLDHARCDPASVDIYLATHRLTLSAGPPHHPLGDARAAATAYWHLTRVDGTHHDER